MTQPICRTVYMATILSLDDGHTVKLGDDLYSCDNLEHLTAFLQERYGRKDVHVVPVPVLHVDADRVFDLKEGQRLTRMAAQHMEKAFSGVRRG